MRKTRLLVALGVSLLLAAAVGCAKEQHVTIAIGETGTVVLTITGVSDRAEMEMQMQHAGDEFDMSEGDVGVEMPTASESPSATAPAKAAPEKPAATAGADDPAKKDAELAAKIKAMMERNGPPGAKEAGVEYKVQSVDVQKDVVRMVATMTMKDLKTFIGYTPMILGHMGFQKAVLDKDESGKMRLTLSSGPMRERMGREWDRSRREMEAQGVKGSVRFIMPGKVLSSTLPDTKESETWLAIDAAKPETLDGMKKFMTSDLVITAEPGKLSMDGWPLDSEKLAKEVREKMSGAGDVPVVEAAPGYVAEALMVTTTTSYDFPEARKILKERIEELATPRSPDGCMVQAELRAPKGRHILNLVSVRALTAVDDQGRKIAPAAEDERSVMYSRPTEIYDEYASDGRTRTEDRDTRIPMQIRLAIPPVGAKAIDKLDGEAVVVTRGGWKEHPVDDVQPDAKKEIDLSDLLPGAKMVITLQPQKAGSSSSNAPISVKISGPDAIRWMQVEGKGPPGALRAWNTSSRSGGGTAERTFVLQTISGGRTATLDIRSSASDSSSPEAAAKVDKAGKISLLIKFPADLKRERVKFTLEAIDLF
jgi:hypothetical protein